MLVTAPAGYCLRVRPDELDVTHVERLVAEGRRTLTSGHAEDAAAQLREPLELWHGCRSPSSGGDRGMPA